MITKRRIHCWAALFAVLPFVLCAPATALNPQPEPPSVPLSKAEKAGAAKTNIKKQNPASTKGIIIQKKIILKKQDVQQSR